MTKPNFPLPLLEWLLGYRKEWVRPDLVAGLTTAAVVIPKAMAYATIAGLPVQVGLYTAFVPLIIYAVLGTSRPMSVTTTTTIAILTGATLDQLVPNGNASTLLQVTGLLTLMVGGMLILASALRLGFVANFISEPVLVGFKAGIAVVIIVDQLPKILGIHFTKGSFLHDVRGHRAGTSPRIHADASSGHCDDRWSGGHRKVPAQLARTTDRRRGRRCGHCTVRLAEPGR